MMTRITLTIVLIAAIALLYANSARSEDPVKELQFGVGTFRIRVGEQVLGWLSVNGEETVELWMFDKDWSSGLRTHTAASFEHVDETPRIDVATLKNWITTKRTESHYDNAGLHNKAREHAISKNQLTSNPTGANPVDGIGTFRVRVGSTVLAWLAVQSNQKQIWIFDDKWETLRKTTGLCFELVDLDGDPNNPPKVFTTPAAFHHWIVNNTTKSGYDGSGIQAQKAHTHTVADKDA